jgi:hypothetical protein
MFQKQGGYVLLLTLGIIALASIALAGLARRSLNLATSAGQAADDLQRRWGLVSVRRVLLDRAAEILEAQVPDELASLPPWPKPAQVSASFLLGDRQFSVTLADEDAKADLNAIYTRKRDRFLPAIRQLSRDAQFASPDVQIMPNAGSGIPFTSWGQVFELASSSIGNNASDALVSLSNEMTCWSSGRLNLRRASDSAVREIASLALPGTEVGELVQHRKDWGGAKVEELLDELALRRPQYLAARRLLDTKSRSFSLWVEIEDGRRGSSYLYVDNGRPIGFAW